MNRNAVRKTSLPAIVLFACLASPVRAGEVQSFSIDWYSIDAGGVMHSSGGSFELSGTIGQADASPAREMSGGQWKLTGGFWAFSLEDLADRLFGDRFEQQQGG
ncbi:MAG: hypothetical protein HND55_11020 [Pseudomonadota bacterium]|nr:MAG: hypothetical protein HND55_11020 [Pseudomonadota bacterium]